MSEFIWTVRTPEGRVIGASARDAWAALHDVADDHTMTVLRDGFVTTGEPPFSFMGYTLTRTPLPAAAPVVVLDEWRVFRANGQFAQWEKWTEADARKMAKSLDKELPQNAPHRVMRVALVEVPADA